MRGQVVLEQIRGPWDIQGLNACELKELCADIRRVLVDGVTETGGHLSSNLGIVELTVALHRVFNSPVDRIVWDVGHQGYVHKLLTGRGGRFDSLRQYGGLSGFPDPAESVHDAFVAGHAGTGISAAMGMAIARDRLGGGGDVVAVIGDGSLTTGMSYEALNHVGHLRTGMVIVLNDNGMSISPTAGSLARRLHMFRTGAAYSRVKRDADDALSSLPWGRRFRWLLSRLKAGFKSMVTPVMLFEDLGLTYLGPVDGHNVEAIERVLRRARVLRRPVVVHVITQKGRGYGPAERDPVAFHGLSPKRSGKEPGLTYTDAFTASVRELLEQDCRIVVLTAAMLQGTGLSGVAAEFPGRIFDVGIAEQHAVTLAAGMAAGGLKPVVAIYSTFLQRAFDQIVHDVCLPSLPVIFAIDRSGIVGEDGKTHQGIFDLAYLGAMPHMKIVAPRDGQQLRMMMRLAVNNFGPIAIRYPRAELPVAVEQVGGLSESLDEAEVLREGSDLLIVAVGSMVMPSLEAAESLALEGVDVAVIDARGASPLDRDAICSEASKVGIVLTVEEHVRTGGFGSAVRAVLDDEGLERIHVRHLALPDEFVTHGDRKQLLALYRLDAEGIATACREVLACIYTGGV